MAPTRQPAEGGKDTAAFAWLLGPLSAHELEINGFLPTLCHERREAGTLGVRDYLHKVAVWECDGES